MNIPRRPYLIPEKFFLLEVVPLQDPYLLVFVGNPTQYHSPIFRKLSEKLNGRVQIMYGDEIGARPFFNPELNAVIDWDVPVLEGFPYKFFYNSASSDSKGFWSRNNPGLIKHVLRSPAKYVLIHGYDTLSSWYVYFAAKLSGKKIIWRGETVAKPGSKNSWASFIKGLILPLYFRGVYKVLWSCLNNRDYLATFLRRKSEKLVRFPCAVDNDFFRAFRLDEQGVKASRHKHNIAEDHIIIATCSRLTKRKRTHLILDAMAKMSTKKVTLLIIGDGPERLALEEQAKRLNISVRIFGFVGQIEVAKLLAISDIFALLSFYDASPKALNEAMNFPLAMIASSGIGTARDLVRMGENGYIFNDGQENDLISWLDNWANDINCCRSNGSMNGKILEEYTIEEDVNNLLSIIDV
jgi:glycosyltransferase involved in cell wall biosynthesis